MPVYTPGHEPCNSPVRCLAGRNPVARASARYDKHSPYLEIRLNNLQIVKAQREYHWALFEAGRVDGKLFELIMVAVAQANECDYCAGSHRENLIELLAIIGTCDIANMIVSSLNVPPQDRKGEFSDPE